jgi:F-type H+-transporting ATPase subunit epsilon
MRLSITTPKGAVVDTDVEEVTAPGVLGEMGVLPGHVPLMTALRPGVLVYRGRERSATLAVGEGFLQVSPSPVWDAEAHTWRTQGQDRVLVLVDRAMPASAINRDAAQQDLAKAEAELAGWKKELDGTYQALVVRRDWALARIAASSR